MDAAGQPALEMELYMRMLGHVAFVRNDSPVSENLHQSGSAPVPLEFSLAL
jgi:hypothetical protein